MTVFLCRRFSQSLAFGALVLLAGFEPARASTCQNVFSELPRAAAEGPAIRSGLLEEILDRETDAFEGRFKTAKLGHSATLKHLLKSNHVTAEAYRLFADENFDVVIFRPESRRDSFRGRQRLTTVHETGNSGAQMMANPDKRAQYLEARTALEADLLGVSRAEYEKIPAAERAHYGLLRRRWDDPNYKRSTVGETYGTDVFILKKSAIRERTFFFMGDSMDRLSVRNEPYGAGGIRFWDEALIPWGARGILAIETAPTLKQSGQIALYENIRPQDFKDFYLQNNSWEIAPYQRRETRHALLPTTEGPVWNNQAPYIESHIFGQLRLSDIEAFEFRRQVPSKDFLKMLRDAGIVVLDGRGEKPVVYTEGPSAAKAAPRKDSVPAQDLKIWESPPLAIDSAIHGQVFYRSPLGGEIHMYQDGKIYVWESTGKSPDDGAWSRQIGEGEVRAGGIVERITDPEVLKLPITRLSPQGKFPRVTSLERATYRVSEGSPARIQFPTMKTSLSCRIFTVHAGGKSFPVAIPESIRSEKLIAGFFEALKVLPVRHLDAIKMIRLVPEQDFMADGSPYNASAGIDGVMDVMPMSFASIEKGTKQFQVTLRHEFGHLLAVKLFGTLNPPGYADLAKQDRGNLNRFAKDNWAEDFAEAVENYIATDAGRWEWGSRDRLGKRFEFLDRIFRD